MFYLGEEQIILYLQKNYKRNSNFFFFLFIRSVFGAIFCKTNSFQNEQPLLSVSSSCYLK